jgi:hypothetical protein
MKSALARLLNDKEFLAAQMQSTAKELSVETRDWKRKELKEKLKLVRAAYLRSCVK